MIENRGVLKKGFTPTPKNFGVSLRSKRGFTLIELLVVIAIIGILSSVVLASLNSARKKARDSRRVTDIQQYRTALEFYFDDFGAYPLDSAGGPLPALGAQYIAETPEDPLGNPVNPYKYISDAEGTSYCAGADLEAEANVLNTCNAVDIGDAYNFKIGP